MEIGGGIALAGLCISGGAVAITAMRTFVSSNKDNYKNGNRSRNLCSEHSGFVACMASIKNNIERQEKWLGEISGDIKRILEKRS